MPAPVFRVRHARGFTLVELMVTLVLIGLLGTVVALSAPAMVPPQRRAAEALARHLAAARDEALLSGNAVRLRLDATGYRFERRDFGDWRPIDEAPLAPVPWPAGVTPQLARAESTRLLQWDAQGVAEAGELRLRGETGSARLRLHGDGRVEVLADVR